MNFGYQFLDRLNHGMSGKSRMTVETFKLVILSHVTPEIYLTQFGLKCNSNHYYDEHFRTIVLHDPKLIREAFALPQLTGRPNKDFIFRLPNWAPGKTEQKQTRL